MNYWAHETAIVDKGAQIGVGSKVWHWVHICGGAQVGKGVSLGQNVFVGNKVITVSYTHLTLPTNREV